MPFRTLIRTLKTIQRQALLQTGVQATKEQVNYSFRNGYYPIMRRGAITPMVTWKPRVPWKEVRNNQEINHDGDYPPLDLSGELKNSVTVTYSAEGIIVHVPKFRSGSTPFAPQLGEAEPPALLGDIQLLGGTNERGKQVPARPFMPTRALATWSFATDTISRRIRNVFRIISRL